MRRFSQKSSLVTLNEINITPLLDLAFVLLIIFIIASPLMERNLKLDLPKGGQPETQVNKGEIRTVSIKADGTYWIGDQELLLQQLESVLVRDYSINPNMIVYIRADENGRNKETYAVINVCQRNGITRFSLRTDPGKP